MPPNISNTLFLFIYYFYNASYNVSYLLYKFLQLQNGQKKKQQIKVWSLSVDAAHTKQKPSCSKSMVFLWIQTTPCSPGTLLQHSLYIWFSIADYFTELSLAALRPHARSHRQFSYSSGSSTLSRYSKENVPHIPQADAVWGEEVASDH